MDQLKRLLYIFLLLIPLISLKAQVSYSDVKAVFIERFTRFIQWPENSIKADTTRPFLITVMNDKDFYNTLNKVYKHQKIYNKKVRVKLISDYKDIKDCHILFIGNTQKNHLDAIIKITRERHILTISDNKGFAEKGVQINFFIKDNQIRFEINEKAIKDAGFSVSYLLLNVAKIVRTKN